MRTTLVLALLVVQPLIAQEAGPRINARTRLAYDTSSRRFDVEITRAAFETETVIEEGKLFNYTTPRLVLNSKTTCKDEATTRAWKIGFCQILRENLVRNIYGTDAAEWRMPVLPLLDSADAKHAPWYGGAKGFAFGWGVATNSMADAPAGQVAWAFRPGQAPRLTGIERRQVFSAYLCAYDEANDRLWILREIRWHIAVRLAVDVTRPLGKRGRVVHVDKKVTVLPWIEGIRASWLCPPVANLRQKLVPLPGLLKK